MRQFYDESGDEYTCSAPEKVCDKCYIKYQCITGSVVFADLISTNLGGTGWIHKDKFMNWLLWKGNRTYIKGTFSSLTYRIRR